MKDLIICDFCSAPRAPWVFEADSFVAFKFEEFDIGSDGGWAACDTCKQLVDSGDVDGLVRHSRRSMIYEHPLIAALDQAIQDELFQTLRNVVLDFFKHRRVS